jgi:galactokinase
MPGVELSISHDIAERFTRRFGGHPRVYRAPGRVNLIGEHTDYNDGFVMPMAIDASTWVAIAPRDDRRLVVHSETVDSTAEIALDLGALQPRKEWSDYVFGVAAALMAAGVDLRGANILIHSDVPRGAGLSSSAALEVSVGFALMDSLGVPIDLVALARLCQRAENDFVGARCGIMDQFIACHGKVDRALMLDCRSLQYRALPVPSRARLVVCNTMVKHQVATGEYNTRRAECEGATHAFARHKPDVRALRDVTVADLTALADSLPPPLLRRARHIVTENQRVLDAASALDHGDLRALGALMTASHQSLRDDFALSCEELDVMVDLASPLPGVYGARMTGGGFGGCTVNLVADAVTDAFVSTMREGYARKTGIVPEIYVCSAARGVERVVAA